jgi:hypothetical protein
MKLEIGKTYKNNCGEDVLIVSDKFNGKYPIIGIRKTKYSGDKVSYLTRNGVTSSLKHDITTLEVNTVIMVKDKSDETYIPRHFSHFTNRGKVYCFENGKSIFTAKPHEVRCWDQWSLK